MAPPRSNSARRRRQRGPRLELRVYMLGLLILCVLGGLVAKLWWVQVARGEVYRAKISGRSYVTVRIPSVRGEIRDRNGIPLVQNRASYEVDFYLPDMVRGFKQQHDGQAPQIQYQGTQKGMPINQRRGGHRADREHGGRAPAGGPGPGEGLQREEAEDCSTATTRRFPSPTWRTSISRPSRSFPSTTWACRAWISPSSRCGNISTGRWPRTCSATWACRWMWTRTEAKKFTFYQPDVEGKSQIELAMDKYLRGSPGVRVMQRNTRGMIDSEVRTDPPKPGDNVYLTIDARIQMIAEQALRQPLLGRAAAVVVDPNNGDILAMASIPSFDPNVFIPSVSGKDWDALNKNPAVPLVDRAVSGFPPGSTFKIVTALAGLRKGMANAHYNCPGSITYGDRAFHCWIAEKGGSHGVLGLADALKVSCDCFFYQYGNAAGIESMDQIGEPARVRPEVRYRPLRREGGRHARAGMDEGEISRRRNGAPPTRRTSPSARGTCWPRRCSSPWPTPPWRMAASATRRGWSRPC